MRPSEPSKRVRIANDSLASVIMSTSRRRTPMEGEQYAVLDGVTYTYRPLSSNEDSNDD